MDYRVLKKGDKFYIDANLCGDEELMWWYEDNDYPVLTVDFADKEAGMVWVKDCDYGIQMNEVLYISKWESKRLKYLWYIIKWKWAYRSKLYKGCRYVCYDEYLDNEYWEGR